MEFGFFFFTYSFRPEGCLFLCRIMLVCYLFFSFFFSSFFFCPNEAEFRLKSGHLYKDGEPMEASLCICFGSLLMMWVQERSRVQDPKLNRCVCD